MQKKELIAGAVLTLVGVLTLYCVARDYSAAEMAAPRNPAAAAVEKTSATAPANAAATTTTQTTAQ